MLNVNHCAPDEKTPENTFIYCLFFVYVSFRKKDENTANASLITYSKIVSMHVECFLSGDTKNTQQHNTANAFTL